MPSRASLRRVSSGVTTIKGATDDPTWKQHIEAAITACNNDKDVCPAPPAKIQKFAIVPNFSVETGEFTPTLKLKRSVVEDKYIEEIKASHSIPSLRNCGLAFLTLSFGFVQALYGTAYVEKK